MNHNNPLFVDEIFDDHDFDFDDISDGDEFRSFEWWTHVMEAENLLVFALAKSRFPLIYCILNLHG